MKILKTLEISIFDARNELSGSKIVEKMHLNVQNGQFWQILDHAEKRLLKSKFGWKRSKFKNLKCRKICIFQPIFTILVAIPTNSATGSSILPSESTFSQDFENLIFCPQGVVLKTGFWKFSQNWKNIFTNCFFQQVTLWTHLQKGSYNHGAKITSEWEKSKKPIFGVIFRVKMSIISSQSVYPAKCIFYKSA